MAITWTSIKEKASNALKFASKLLTKAVCVFDDIPFLLTLKNTGNVGPLLLVGAGLLMFPIGAYEGIKGLRKAFRKGMGQAERKALIVTSAIKLGLAVIGFIASVTLLAFVLTNLVVLAAAASITIPTVMAVVGGVELAHDLHSLSLAKQNVEGVEEAKRDVAYSAAFFGFGLAIATLATLSVLTGLGVISFGIIPSAILVGVVVIALAVKIFQILDTKKVKDENGKTVGIEHPLSTALENGWNKLKSMFGFSPSTTEKKEDKRDMPNLHAALGVTSVSAVPHELPAHERVDRYAPIKPLAPTPTVVTTAAPRCVMV